MQKTVSGEGKVVSLSMVIMKRFVLGILFFGEMMSGTLLQGQSDPGMLTRGLAVPGRFEKRENRNGHYFRRGPQSE
jgi:hypothetical protein